jgi:hypothetical protein
MIYLHGGPEGQAENHAVLASTVAGWVRAAFRSEV